MNGRPLLKVLPFGQRWMGTCPGCGLRAHIDRDQYEGRVSVDCPDCDYHETHDLRTAQGDGVAPEDHAATTGDER